MSSKYLGAFLMGDECTPVRFIDDLIPRVRAKLDGWKQNIGSLATRKVLLQSIFDWHAEVFMCE